MKKLTNDKIAEINQRLPIGSRWRFTDGWEIRVEKHFLHSGVQMVRFRHIKNHSNVGGILDTKLTDNLLNSYNWKRVLEFKHYKEAL